MSPDMLISPIARDLRTAVPTAGEQGARAECLLHA